MRLKALSFGCVMAVFGLAAASHASEHHFEPFDANSLNAERALLLAAPTPEVSAAYMDEVFFSDCDSFVNKHYPWETRIGKEQYSAAVKTDLFLYADCYGYRSGGNATVDGRLLNVDFDLADASIEAKAIASTASIDAAFFVLKYEVASYSESKEVKIDAGGRPEYNIQKEGRVVTAIGPIPVTLDYGVVGKADLRWRAAADFSGVDANIYPRVNTDGYLLGGLSAYGIVEAKAGGYIKLIEDQVSLESHMGLVNRDNKANLLVRATAHNEFSALQGHFNAKVTTIGNKVIYEKDFFKWDGVSRADKIAEYEKAIPLDEIFMQTK